MKWLFYIVIAAFALRGVEAGAQNQISKEEAKRIAREEKAALKKARKEADAQWEQETYNIARKALKKGEFVIEANQLIFPYGEVVNVSPMTNFISMKEERVCVQIAIMNHMPGYNGLGGLTVEGTPTKIESENMRNDMFRYRFSVMGVGISATVEIQLRGDGNNVTATIYPNFSNNKLEVRGKLVPTDDSRIFKGSTL